MKLLFLHQNFPGQYLHSLLAFHAEGTHDLLFLSQPNTNRMAGVRKMTYPAPRPATPGIEPFAADFEAAMLRARAVAGMARRLHGLGYVPDAILGHNGWGETLHLRELWPRVPILAYFEFFYHAAGLDVDFDPEFPIGAEHRSHIRARNAVNLLGLEVATLGQSPTAFQRGTYPAWAQEKLRLVPEGVDLDLCAPEAGASFTLGERSWRRGRGRKLITYVARNLEPYRGLHVVLRALPRLLAACPNADVVLVGGEGVSYGAACPGGSWRDHFLRELGGRLDLSRVFFAGSLAYDAYRALLRASSLHLYFSYPFVASWSLREALATGCCVLASDTAPVREFVADGETGTLVPFLDTDAIAEAAAALLGDGRRRARLSRAARAWAERHLRLPDQHGALNAALAEAVAMEAGLSPPNAAC